MCPVYSTYNSVYKLKIKTNNYYTNALWKYNDVVDGSTSIHLLITILLNDSLMSIDAIII